MGALISEYLLLKTNQSAVQIRMLAVSAKIHLLSFGILLVTGLLRWFVYGKGALYYSKNPVFHTKLTIYAVIVILAVMQTAKIFKWNRQKEKNDIQLQMEAATGKIFLLLRLEIILVIIIPLLAVIVMRGAGS